MSNMPRHLIQDRYQLYIGGAWCDASDGATFDSFCPANGERLCSFAEAAKSDVDAAVTAAWNAFPSWRAVPLKERSQILGRIADTMEQNLELLAQVESMDTGKPIRETRTLCDVPQSIEHFRYFAGVACGEEGSAVMLDEATMSIVLREPVGVVGQIVPWNYPLLMAAWKLAPILASGCCTVFKPSSNTSLSVLVLMQLIQDIVPPGVINVVTGSGSRCGQYLLEHPDIRKLAFTGSTDVGISVAHAAADKIIPATLELGGKSANIVFEDCDWELAMEGVMSGVLFNQGQDCGSGSRVFVQKSIYDQFTTELAHRFENIKIGLPWENDTVMGSMIHQKQLQRVLDYVKTGCGEGAQLITGGIRVTEGKLSKGYYIYPAILAHATNDMRVAQEEIFGPVAVLIPFEDEQDVIHMANDNKYGLAGGVFSRNINRALRVARAVETGRMWVNTYGLHIAGAPYGGVKQSGYGRECSKSILRYYTYEKNVMINLTENSSGIYFGTDMKTQ